MARKRPTTTDEYIQAAPSEGQPHLRRLYAILKSVAPEAEEVIKWGNPFFVEPRFLFAFSAHKAHCNLMQALRSRLQSAVVIAGTRPAGRRRFQCLRWKRSGPRCRP